MTLEIQGSVLAKGTPEYEETRQKNFAANAVLRSGSHPSIIALASSQDDVQTCIQYAIAEGITVSVRSGGHNWFGASLRDDTLLIDMTNFKNLEIDAANKTAVAGPSVDGMTLNAKAAEHGLCFPAGHCPGVPVGGFLLGGGYGWFEEHFGIGAESVLGATIVTPDGAILDVDDETQPDWMWLLRGSASAFPGVVVSYRLRLHDLPPIIRNKSVFYPPSELEKVVGFLYSHRADGSMSTKIEAMAIVACTPPPLAQAIPSPKVCMLSINGMADSEEEFSKIMAVFDELPAGSFMASEFENHSLVSLTEMLGAAFPASHRWVTGSYVVDFDAYDKIPFNKIQASFVELAPMGFTSTLCAVSPRRETPENAPGAYGKFSNLGLLVLCYGTYATEEEAPATKKFCSSIDELMDPIVTRYNPLEHRFDESTFHKCFENPEKVLTLRQKVDAKGLFFDPSKAHLSQ